MAAVLVVRLRDAGSDASRSAVRCPGCREIIAACGPPSSAARAEPGGTDIYINPADFGSVHAGGLSPAQTAIASVVQRPITAAALGDPATGNPPASVPKWEIVALQDHAIPTQAEFFMAKRADARIVTTNSGHDVPQAQPGVVDSVILQAVQSAS
jgi:hypothetical protein